ncbi:MAG TPA: SDR family oxidoreductase, partial [Paludibacter sp.]|nr:SDR family oxidoreductase [Paludibacter sp.]
MNSQFFNIAEEKLISKEWNFRKRQSSDYPEGILVTGANSYIGVHIISELLKKKEGQIHLLLRAKDSDEAILKMKSAFDRWELDNFDEGSVIIHIG